jgi:hypothetical protein
MKRAIFFVLLITMEIVLLSQNLVINPGFETWDKINKPVGWTTIQNCLKDSVYVNSGIYSCRHEGGTTSKYLGQTVAVIPGSQYMFSFYYKTEITGTGNGCRIWCYWKDLAGSNISDQLTDAILRPSKYLKSDTWQQFTTEIIAPANASFFYLEVRTYQNCTTFWDEFIFEENVTTYFDEEKRECVKIYPNPVCKYLIISNIQNLQYIDIQDLTGMTIWSSHFSCEETVTIPVSGFPEGLYIIRIRTSDKLITRKFIKKAC